MPYNERNLNGGDTTSGFSLPVSRAFAFTVLAAGVFLIVLRYFYGSINIEAGVK